VVSFPGRIASNDQPTQGGVSRAVRKLAERGVRREIQSLWWVALKHGKLTSFAIGLLGSFSGKKWSLLHLPLSSAECLRTWKKSCELLGAKVPFTACERKQGGGRTSFPKLSVHGIGDKRKAGEIAFHVDGRGEVTVRLIGQGFSGGGKVVGAIGPTKRSPSCFEPGRSVYRVFYRWGILGANGRKMQEGLKTVNC